MSITLYINNDNIIEIEGLKIQDGSYINNGDVNLKISDFEGNTIFEKTMNYVSQSNGNYNVVVPYDLDVKTKSYYGEITVDHNSRRGYWEGTIEFRTRRINF